MMRIALLMTVVVLAAFSCRNSAETNKENDTTAQEAIDGQDTGTQVDPLLESYIQLKNALVESDAEAVVTAAESMTGLENVPPEIGEPARHIADSDALEDQRNLFYTLSEAMYNYLKNDPSLSVTVYWQYCPMARDNQGANWLSLESEIRNPYFGDQMLTCGSVEEEL